MWYAWPILTGAHVQPDDFLQDKFGFCFVTSVPPTPEATEGLSCRIGFIRETQCVFQIIFVDRS